MRLLTPADQGPCTGHDRPRTCLVAGTWTSEARKAIRRTWNAAASEPLLIRGCCCGAPAPGGAPAQSPAAGRASGAAGAALDHLRLDSATLKSI